MRINRWPCGAGRWGVAAALAMAMAVTAVAIRAQEPLERESRPRPRDKTLLQDGDAQPPAREETRERRRDAAEYWLGLACVPLPERARDRLHLQKLVPDGQGLLVSRVFPGSPADKAAIKPNDVLSTADGKPLKGTRDLLDVVRAAKDKEFKVELFRDAKAMTVAVTPGKRPEDLEGPVARGMSELDRMYELFDRDGNPMRFRFFHPGMLLPPGASARPPFPDDLTVKITKQGSKPAQIEVSQGDKSWKVTEDKLADLPEDVRAHVAGFMGRPFAGEKFHIEILGPNEGPGGDRPNPGPPGPDRRRPLPDRGPRATESRDSAPPDAQAERRFSRRLDEMSRRLRELRDELDQLRPTREPKPRLPTLSPVRKRNERKFSAQLSFRVSG